MTETEASTSPGRGADLPDPFPFVGRRSELAGIAKLIESAAGGSGGTLFVRGEPGVGKSRLAAVAAEGPRSRGWRVAWGRSFPVEARGPYAVVSDAFTPVLQALGADAVQVLTRGASEHLAPVFPFLHPATSPPAPSLDPPESRTRLLWNLAQFVLRLSEREPVLVILEDVQWADAASIELFHFLARQAPEARVAILVVYNDDALPDGAPLRAAEGSLVALGAASAMPLGPLGRTDVGALIEAVFGVGERVVGTFVDRVHDRTRGNPFFLVELLRHLVESGRLRREGGVWVGWEIRELGLPVSVRESVELRLARLAGESRKVAEIAAVLGVRFTHEALSAVAPARGDALLAAVDDLLLHHVLVESTVEGAIAYDFTHPLVRETLESGLSLARARGLHADVGASLERHYGERAGDHAAELAHHYSRAAEVDPGVSAQAVRYLAAAGRAALERHADEEAARYLAGALSAAEAQEGDVQTTSLVQDLARARQRLGQHEEAAALWGRLRTRADAEADARGVAEAERRLGLAAYWAGDPVKAVERLRAGLSAAASLGATELTARIKLAEGVCLMEAGRSVDARKALEEALELSPGRVAIQAKIHRSLLLLHTWTGPPDVARRHGRAAVALADESGSADLRWSVHWALAVLEGLTGDGAATARELAVCESLERALQSPLRRLWTSEIALEKAWATGEWDEAIALGEDAIRLARRLGQAPLLPRLLVLTAFIHLGRGETEQGKALVDEAWEVSGAGAPRGGSGQVLVVVPAYTGRAAFHLAVGQWEEAIRIGTEGLEIAERTGYVVWGVHRLLPIIAEAHLLLRDLEGARRFGERLRLHSERLGNRLGLAWADACEALVAWLGGEGERSIGLLLNAARDLEAVPFVPDAARVRRQLAGRLAEGGDREGALEELERVHDVFARLGAVRELEKARQSIRELGARPPALEPSAGIAGLSDREMEVARLVEKRMSNKSIGEALGISHRTVSTHLSNIYGKLGLHSRGELVDYVRKAGGYRPDGVGP